MVSNTQPRLDPARFLPDEIQGWKARGKDEAYDRETIFDYIDGGGEVYRSYGFRGLLVRRLHDEAAPEILIDFFDMGTPTDAFGVFTHDLEGERVDIGQEAVYKAGLLSFWQDRYFVSIYSEEETAETKAGLFETGRMISRAIGAEGKKPDIVSCIPGELFDGDVRYFHTHPILNYHFFVSSENILKLDTETEAVLARPARKGAKERLLVVRYPEARQAAAARESFIKAYMPDASADGLVRTEDGTWTGIRIVKNYAAVIFHAVSESDADVALSSAEAQIGRRERDQPPGPARPAGGVRGRRGKEGF